MEDLLQQPRLRSEARRHVVLDGYALVPYVTPVAALIPFILAIFGFLIWRKATVVGLFTASSVLYNTLEGVRSLKPGMLEIARAFRTSELRLWLNFLMPPRFELAFEIRRNWVLRRYFLWYRRDQKAAQ